MNKVDSENHAIEIIESIQHQLEEIEIICCDYRIKERIHRLLDFIEEETLNDKTAFEEMIYGKVRETKGVNPELNTHFYLLYRNLTQGKISMHEAQMLYNMYVKEF